jgi:thiol-disulfide isomerase/thioredoxin
MNRRRTLLVAAAAAGIAAGAGTAVWRAGRSALPQDVDRGVDLWAFSFATLDGPPLRMASLRGRPLLLNFWATWCVPCVTEMPLLDAFARARAPAGWNVLALAVDSADPVRRFLTERGLRLQVALAGDDGIELSRRLGNGVGALPFSIAFDATGRATGRKLGALDAELLEAWVAATRS